VLSVAKLARGRERYYLSTVASPGETSPTLTEPEGRWLGRAAASLGLAGTVEGPVLRALLEGVDPGSGEALSLQHSRIRVAAFDCTYSTPKSVSLLHALGPLEVCGQVRAGHEAAAMAALGYLERRGARVRRTLARGEARSVVPAEGFAAAAFLHRSSRAPDPHLHSHVLVANLGQGPDGRWSALDGRGLFLELRAARDLYETQLRFELTCRLGVSWRELTGAWADIAGVEPSVRRAFSRRSIEIEAALMVAGRSSPHAARIASVRTRPEKDLTTSYEELVSGWRERAYRLGVSDGRFASLVGRGSAVPAVPADRWAEHALGEDGVAARSGSCSRSDLIRSRCSSLPSGASVADVERDVDELVAGGRLVRVPAPMQALGRRLRGASGRSIPGGADEPQYTTPAILAINERLTRAVRNRPGAVTILAYPPGGRLAALDAIGALVSQRNGSIVALAPGRAAAASFESATGIAAAPFAAAFAAGGVRRPARDASACVAGVVVLAEAQRLGPWELSAVVEASLAAGGRVVLFAPSSALATQFCTAAVLSPHLDRFAPVDPGGKRPTAPERELHEMERHCFGGREVVIAADGRAAREAMLDAWANPPARGQRPLLVARDDAVVRALRSAVEEAGGSPGEVLEARRLTDPFACGRSEGGLVVLGALPAGARTGASTLPPAQCVHVAIAPPDASPGERLGRAAEVARPVYLVSELGEVPTRAPERSAWRAGAAVIETFRRRWSIEDPIRAFPAPGALRELGSVAVSDLAETRLMAREAARALELATPHRRGRTLDPPGR